MGRIDRPLAKLEVEEIWNCFVYRSLVASVVDALEYGVSYLEIQQTLQNALKNGFRKYCERKKQETAGH